MTKITDKLKEKVIEAKDKVVETKDKVTDTTKEKAKDAKDKVVETKDKVTDTSKDTIRDTSGAGVKVATKGDSTREYETREPMPPGKIKEHEPTAVKREMTEKITQGGKTATNPEEAKEIARRSGMAKGTGNPRAILAAVPLNKSSCGAISNVIWI